MRRRAITCLALVLAALLATPSIAHAEPGDPDAGFGVCGFMEPALSYSWILDVVVQPDARILVADEYFDGSRRRARVRRFLRDGQLDTSWGSHGTLYLRSEGPFGTSYGAIGIAPGNKVVIAYGDSPDRVITRRDARGARDPSFGVGGNVVIPHGGAGGMTVFRDGSLLAIASDGRQYRLDLAGKADPAFNMTRDARWMRFPASFSPAEDGRIYVGGMAVSDLPAPGTSGGGVLRFAPNGAIDPTFNGDSPSGIPGLLPHGSTAPSVHAVPEGVLEVWSGETWSQSERGLHLQRLRGDGTVDATYGSNGRVDGDFGVPVGRPRVSFTDNGSVTLGTSLLGPYAKPAVARVDANGRIDTSFGAGGATILDFGQEVGLTAMSATAEAIVAGITASNRGVLLQLRTDRTRSGAGLILDWTGTLWPTRFGDDSPPACPFDTPFWTDEDLARGVTAVTGKGGYVVDAYGGMHPFSSGLQRPRPAPAIGGPYWPGWDIVRGVAARADGRGGYVLDGWGGLHRFRVTGQPLPAISRNAPYWRGFDIARGVALMPDGRSGFVLDGYGGLHPFSVGGAPLPPRARFGPYWYGWDIARGVSILPDGTGGYVLDGYGGVHPFALGNHAPPPRPGPGAPYDDRGDWARGFAFVPPIIGTTDEPETTPGPADLTRTDDAVVRIRERPSTPPLR